MKRLFQWFLPIVVLLLSAAIGQYFIRTAPEAIRKISKPDLPVVEIMLAQSVDYTVVIQSRGTISPQIQGTLVAEVAGRILAMSEHFRPGGFFKAGEVLASLDPGDYSNLLTIARSELAQANLRLQEEEAKGVQAREDWQKLGLEGSLGNLALRIPQLKHAQAILAAATARMAQAKRDLERTKILAPYAGRVLAKQVDVGQYVSRGASLATIYAVDQAEVRLPITDRQAAFLTLAEQFHQDQAADFAPQVTLTATVGGKPHIWYGQVVRTEGVVDPKTRQIHVVAQVDNPYRRGPEGQAPLKVGQFVSATIQGRILLHAFLVPRAAFRNAEEILIVSADSRIQRRRLHAVWRDAKNVVVLQGLQAGERIVLTPLPYAPEGMQVEVFTAKPAKKKRKSPRER